MKRNYVYSTVGTVRCPRSSFDLSHGHKTTMNVGDLVPIYCEEVLPGDSFTHIKETHVSQVTSSFIRPVMDNTFCDVRFFFVPDRILLDDWPKIFGENDNPYAQEKYYEVPSFKLPNLTREQSLSFKGSLLDYFGDIAPGDVYNNGLRFSQMPYRAYAKIVNDWYRDENYENAVIYKGESLNDPASGGKSRPLELPTSPGDFGVNNIYGKPFRVNKVHDRFTSLLPSPQKGDPVSLPLGISAPVSFSSKDDKQYIPGAFLSYEDYIANGGTRSQSIPNKIQFDSSALPIESPATHAGFTWAGSGSVSDVTGSLVSSLDGFSPSTSFNQVNIGFGVPIDKVAQNVSGSADLTNATAATVNDLRFAFQLQKQLERMSRGGTRYTEFLSAAFGVTPEDARLQRSEYLGGSRMPMSIQQVTQTGAPTEDDPLGQLAAYGHSVGRSSVSKSFSEYGWIIGVACIRYYHTYQQGRDRTHTRFERLDFYDPVFQSIGEQPVYTSEIYGAVANPDSTILGYTEAWNEFRNRPNRISGALRSTLQNGLDVWHFGDYYQSAPTMTAEYLKEDPGFFGRTLTAGSNEDQFIFDFWFDVRAVRPLPVRSIPSLIDHH